jgi:hypothetical protein
MHLSKSPVKGSSRLLFWEGQLYVISQIIESWRECGEWWEKAPEITVYQVITDTQGLYELHHRATGEWLLYKIYDCFAK